MTYMIHNFAANLSRLRKENGISQTELAEKLKIGKQSISDYEKSKSYPTFATLDKIADYFKASPVQLFGTSQDIELEKSVLKTDEYTEKADKIIRSVNALNEVNRIIQSDTDMARLTDTLMNLSKVSPRKDFDGQVLYRSKNPDDLTYYRECDITGNEDNYEVMMSTEIEKIVDKIEYLKSSQTFDEIMYLTRGKQLFTPDGEPYYRDPQDPNGSYSLNFEPGYQFAYDKSPLELLWEMKDDLDDKDLR